jgi:hypothetical protein
MAARARTSSSGGRFTTSTSRCPEAAVWLADRPGGAFVALGESHGTRE